MANNTYFTDRTVQYPGRVMMTPTGNPNEYDLARAEGNVVTPGTPFNADMFNRIANQIIEDTLAELNDYVVEQGVKQGVNGNWEYRRWKSGKVEAWATIDLGSQTGTVWVTPIRYKDITFSIPTGLFTQAPNMTAVSATSQWWINHIRANSATAVGARILTLAQTAQPATISIYAKGE